MSKNCNCHKKLCEHNNLAINFPEVAAEWNYFKNGNRRPEEFTNNSNFMAVEQLIINIDALDYLSKKRIVLDTLEITNPHITVQKDSNGTMNF